MATRLYGIVWRWHFLAGLAACPVLVILALTGAAYAFSDELERWMKSELFDVAPGGDRLPLDRLAAAVPASCTPQAVVVAPDPTRSVAVLCNPVDDVQHRWFVDPYRGKAIGTDAWSRSFVGIVFQLHWDLMLGDRGRLVVEWAASWGVVLMLSGAYLWWPRGRRSGTWWPRRELAGRQRLRDLHAIAGAYLLPVLLAIAATGLCWTLLAGEQRWERISDDVAHETWDHPPHSTVVDHAPRIGIDAALVAAGIELAREPRQFYVQLPGVADDVYTVFGYSIAHASPSAASSTWIDAYTGRVLKHVGWAEHSAMGAVSNSLYAIHIGSIAGLPGRIAALVAALVLSWLCITGPWMWFKRRPRAGLGVPPRARRTPWPLLVLWAGLGWLLPTVGYTLLAVIVIELGLWAVQRWRAGRAAGLVP
jgi:uncharacterized iron-regulated membrane protein